ncbi:PEP-CTERM sorting domain-containing protein [Endozoicomonas sp. SM1973]|uniref:PEP-CTERM sorting domain-containing protein n=1 Tax=Spartinivicinus marinus TaxID=2994442 RepID=A0A853IIX0_9GAMM|nr:PEP-CTERM sorting domain-containing protein [Spartinivicinus marinus]MCX4025323.1 PEP-CTERM sorting domain-containing protein [Spartinivicinus marinus]NYZ69974.1 PEP-CTERM sorting domain-containing protein [Spartinivicinus marinus]
MKSMKKALGVLALSLAGTTSATAGLLSIEGGQAGTLPGNHNPSGGITKPGLQVTYGGNLKADANVNLTYEFLGSEASFENIFLTINGQSFNNKQSQAGQEIFDSVLQGNWLNFSFQTPHTTVANGNNNDNNIHQADLLKPSFFLAAAGENSFYIGLNDDGGHFDYDFDDMVLKVTATKTPTPVPVPGTVALIGLGLLALRKRNR